jgi:hypothetical protein
MKRNILIWFIFLIIMISSISPILSTAMLKTDNPLPSNNNVIFFDKKTVNKNTIKLAIYHSKQDGSLNFTIKEIPMAEYQALRNNITKKISLTNIYDKPFESILEMLKVRGLINDNTRLEDIFDDKTSIVYNSTEYNLSIMEPFLAHFAPIILVGMGFGGGIGDKFGSLSGLLYSFGVIGLGGVLCIDALAKTIYIHYTFTFPLLFHLLSSFVGIMMFPVDFDFISSSGLPIFIYSNFIAIGHTALAIGFPIGY